MIGRGMTMSAGGICTALCALVLGVVPGARAASTSNLAATPELPASVTPGGGWAVAYGDTFQAPLGTAPGEDNTWYSGPVGPIRGNNPSYDINAYSSTQTTVAGGDMQLTAKYSPTTPYLPRQGSYPAVYYESGYATTMGAQGGAPSGYHEFTWLPETEGVTWAFQITTRWPVNTNDLFNSFWSYAVYGSGSGDERDFFEGRPWNGSPEEYWIDSDSLSPVIDLCWDSADARCHGPYGDPQPFDPAAADHTYTYLITPGGGWSLYIDGVLQPWAHDRPASDNQTDDVPMALFVDYLLVGGDDHHKGTPTSDPGFESGTRSMTISSVAVYQDAANAGDGVSGAELAPGTTCSGCVLAPSAALPAAIQ